MRLRRNSRYDGIVVVDDAIVQRVKFSTLCSRPLVRSLTFHHSCIVIKLGIFNEFRHLPSQQRRFSFLPHSPYSNNDKIESPISPIQHLHQQYKILISSVFRLYLYQLVIEMVLVRLGFPCYSPTWVAWWEHLLPERQRCIATPVSLLTSKVYNHSLQAFNSTCNAKCKELEAF